MASAIRTIFNATLLREKSIRVTSQSIYCNNVARIFNATLLAQRIQNLTSRGKHSWPERVDQVPLKSGII